AGQLERPLQRAAPAAPTRWHTWLAAVVAVWGLRETLAITARAQAATECRPQYSGGPVPTVGTSGSQKTVATQEAQAAGRSLLSSTSSKSVLGDVQAAAAPVLRGSVTDAGSSEPVPGCTVLIVGTVFGVITNAEGQFELPVPESLLGAREITLTVMSVGFVSQQRTLVASTAPVEQVFRLQQDVKGMLMDYVRKMPPAPWHPRRFYYWSKYWLSKPFRN
ncbi:carboxypeptidase-like regulatory domain-containing protein, partial [Hymenobacter sp. IS2118]|uniref:carboxypeptidase-like regulatory domain-containing protein n=1 Tax=Hymenobacter sp. IS2118 TaxID=1505605 RepID=UPI001269877B